jgi:hypothetical protein
MLTEEIVEYTQSVQEHKSIACKLFSNTTGNIVLRAKDRNRRCGPIALPA